MLWFFKNPYPESFSKIFSKRVMYERFVPVFDLVPDISTLKDFHILGI